MLILFNYYQIFCALYITSTLLCFSLSIWNTQCDRRFRCITHLLPNSCCLAFVKIPANENKKFPPNQFHTYSATTATASSNSINVDLSYWYHMFRTGDEALMEEIPLSITRIRLGQNPLLKRHRSCLQKRVVCLVHMWKKSLHSIFINGSIRKQMREIN